MFDFLKRDAPGIAQVYFPGSAPPPLEAFGRLRDARIEIEPLPSTDDETLWAATLRHPDWGEARIAFVRDAPPAEPLVRYAGSLTRDEKDAASVPTVGIALTVPARRKEVLADRKTMLRFARALLGDDGVVAIDMASQLAWSRAALDEELAHDADLDVQSLFCLHIVFDEGDGDPSEAGSPWMHTHGLHELGAFDLDVLAAHPTFVSSSPDLFRALAFRALDGDVAPGADRVLYAYPRFELSLVPANRFMAEAADAWRALRDADHHDEHRVVLCEPSRRRLFGRGGSRPEPLSLARRRFPDPFAAIFPTTATTLMAGRARATTGLFRSLAAEFEPYGVHVLAKLGLATRSGEREHLWFEVHELTDTDLDGTLVNRPIDVDIRGGARGRWPLDLLTDWTIVTPIGQITPRSQLVARNLRAHGPGCARRCATPEPRADQGFNRTRSRPSGEEQPSAVGASAVHRPRGGRGFRACRGGRLDRRRPGRRDRAAAAGDEPEADER